MKVLLPILCLLCCCFSAEAQKKSSDYFEKGAEYLKRNELDSALSAYKYIVDHYPEEDEYREAVYNIGYICYTQMKFDTAIVVFKSMLTGKVNDLTSSAEKVPGMNYKNSQHYASQMLCRIYTRKKKYKHALHYLALSDNVYGYWSLCENAYASDEISKVMMYADIYERQHKPDAAIKVLLPQVFSLSADNKEVVKALENLLKEKSAVKAQLDKSLTAIYPIVIHSWERDHTVYYIRFMGTEIATPISLRYGEEEYNEQRTIERIKASAFYKMVETL